jgi:hypothetical protein
MSDRIAAAADTVRRWIAKPVEYVRENFGAEPDAWQADGLNAFVSSDPKMQRIALQACSGPGKSTLMAWCAWLFLSCVAEKGKHPNAFAMSVTGDNLKDGLWKELAVWRAASPLLMREFEWTQTRIFHRQHAATWWMSARTFPKKADAQAQGRTLSGLHSPYIAYFVDESGDIPTVVERAAEQGLSTKPLFGKIMQSGNPTSHDGMLYEAVDTQSDLWHVIRITGDPDEPKRSPRIDIDWARQQIKTHGRDNPWVMAFILGQFPPSAINALLSPDEVREAMSRVVPDSAYGNVQKRLGIDPARFGDDRTVIFPRQGLRAFKPVEMRGARTDAIAARIANAKRKWGSEMELIDSTGGYGAGVEDQCRLGGIDLIPINFSSNALDTRYFNRRSEMQFLLAEWVKNGGQLPNVPGIVKEACAATYTFHKGRLRVEEKDQVKKKLNGHSPDYWDALMVTFALPDRPRSVENMLGLESGTYPRSGMDSDWDPLEERRGSLIS